MVFQEGGVWKKFVCPSCGGDNIGESGLGGERLHCFGKCMMHLGRDDCKVVEVTDEKELAALQQEPY
jgi:hypothetical protein